MIEIVSIKLLCEPFANYYKTNNIKVNIGTICIVNTEFGEEAGKVVKPPISVEKENLPKNIRNIVRIATKDDYNLIKSNEEKQKNSFKICQQKILSHNLPMKLILCRYVLNSSKIIFYFTADRRIDFRKLVKDLASTLKARIELRQIGPREATSLLGGCGLCGLEFCCVRFKQNFELISVKMAKEQNLSLNTQRITGTCERLLCCLTYEYDTYLQLKKEFPKIGSYVKLKPTEKIKEKIGMLNLEKLKCKINSINLIKKTVFLEFEKEKIFELPLEDIIL